MDETIGQEWSVLRDKVLDCKKGKCPRHEKKNCKRIAVLFNRERVVQAEKAIVLVSQDPAVVLRKKCGDDAVAIEKELVEDCRRKDFGNKPASPYVNQWLKEVLQTDFDPRKDPIYWTHSLKCLPCKSNSEAVRDWPKASEQCLGYLREELLLLARKEIDIVATGRLAIDAVLLALGKKPIPPKQKLLEFLSEMKGTTESDKSDLTFGWEGRVVRLYLFPHARWWRRFGRKKMEEAGLGAFVGKEEDGIRANWAAIQAIPDNR